MIVKSGIGRLTLASTVVQLRISIETDRKFNRMRPSTARVGRATSSMVRAFDMVFSLRRGLHFLCITLELSNIRAHADGGQSTYNKADGKCGETFKRVSVSHGVSFVRVNG